MKKASKNLFRLYPFCIFCNAELPSPEKRSGAGEHVIPESIFGFWRSYDVCPECIKFFGDNIDHIATQNPNILHSMDLLKIKDVEKHYEQMNYQGEDTSSKIKIPMVRRKGNYKTKATITPNFIECSESDFDVIVKEDFKRLFASKFSSDKLDSQFEKLKESYLALKPGGSLTWSGFGEIRKRQVTNIEYDFNNMPSIIPLIAKIAFISIHYFIPVQLLSSFTLYEAFKKQARYNESLPDHTINFCVIRKSNERYPFHCIRFLPGGHSLLVDVMFFGYDNWRCVLPFTQEVILNDGKDTIEKFSFFLDFRDLRNKRKFLANYYPDGTYKEFEIFA